MMQRLLGRPAGQPEQHALPLHTVLILSSAAPPSPRSGYSGAQLANLVNMAATAASQRGSEDIHNQDFEKVCAV